MRLALSAALLLVVGCRAAARNDDAGSESEPTTADSETGDAWDTGVSTGFVPPGPDLPWRCDPWEQDCPEGEKCVPYVSSGSTWDATKCVPILGEQPPGEPCSSAGPVEATDDCDATGVCWNLVEVDAALIGECWGFCTGPIHSASCPPNHLCRVDSGGDVINLCEAWCDPLAQDCAEGTACFWDSGRHIFRCLSTTEDIPPGQPCGFDNDCASGSHCVTGDRLPACADAACCTPFCWLSLGDAGCEALPGTSCVAFFPEGAAMPADWGHVGVCLLP